MKHCIFLIYLLFIMHAAQAQSYTNLNIDSAFYMKEMSYFLDTSYLDRYEYEIRNFEKKDSIIGISRGKVLFLGSSTIKNWETLEKDMFPIPTVNRGFGGSTLPEVIYYFHRIVKPYKPSVIVLYEGDNDVTAHYLTHEIVLDSFRLFVKLCKMYLPHTHIYYISIKPSPARVEYIDKILITNQLVKKYCVKKENLFYIDITSVMFDDHGYLIKSLYLRDGLHLSEDGYKIWTPVIKDALLKNKKAP